MEAVKPVTIYGPFTREEAGCGYFLGKTEVTESQWEAIMSAGEKSQKPTVRKSYAEIMTFVESLQSRVIRSPSFPKTHDGKIGEIRLPTEAEWEYAVRGGASAENYQASDPYQGDIERHEVISSRTSGHARDVASYPPNSLGLYDMLGNVKELVDGRYLDESGGGRMLKGGCYTSEKGEIRSSARTEQSEKSLFAGFRLCISANFYTSLDKALSVKMESRSRQEIAPTSGFDSIAPALTSQISDSQAPVSRLETSTLDSSKGFYGIAAFGWIVAALLATTFGWLHFMRRNGKPVEKVPKAESGSPDSDLKSCKVICSHCWERFEAHSDCIGSVISCPVCNEKLHVSKRTQTQTASLEFPYENSLGMRFIPVPGTNVLLSAWDTRVKDFQTYADVVENCGNVEWQEPGFYQTQDDPVINVSWNDANAFCKWLTILERQGGHIKNSYEYRLPTDAEWSVAVGLGSESGTTPKQKDSRARVVYQWGSEWRPPIGAGNFNPALEVDSFDNTSPVGSFVKNRWGLYDMVGNVRQWCIDCYSTDHTDRVIRGSSWIDHTPEALSVSFRTYDNPDARLTDCGFRCVLSKI